MWFRKRELKTGFATGLSRRGFLAGVLVAPAIITTKGLLMPVKVVAAPLKAFQPWFGGVTPLWPPESFGIALTEASILKIDEFLDAVHDGILANNGQMPDMSSLVKPDLMALLA